MNDQQPERSTGLLKLALAAYTLVFAVAAYYAMIRTSAATLTALDWDSCWPGAWPCTTLDAGWPLAAVATVSSILLQVAAIFLHVRSVLYARRPGRGRASLAYGAIALLLVVATFAFSTHRLSTP